MMMRATCSEIVQRTTRAGKYQEWVKRTHHKVAVSGAREDASAGTMARAVGTAAGQRQLFGRQRARVMGREKAGGAGQGQRYEQELKTADQVNGKA